MSPAVPLRILHTESSLNWGGQEYRTLEEVRWLREHGHMAWIACDPESELMKRAGPEFCVPVKMPRSTDWRASREIRKFCREQRIDVIHTHSSKDSWLCYPMHVTSWTVVRSRQITNPVRPSWDRSFIYRHGCSAVVASAECIRQNLVSRTRVAANRVHVIGEGTDLERFSPSVDGSQVRAEWGVAADDVLFGLVAMIRPEKGHDVFVSAAVELLRSHGGKVRFAIIGEGVGDRSHERHIRGRLTELFGSAERGAVFMTGYRCDIPQVMAALDVLVVPSLAEAQSIVTPQAFSSGRPVIASRVGGLPELVTDGETGLLVEPNDVKALSESMVRMVDDSAFRSLAGEKARKFAQRVLSFGTKMQECVSFYSRMIATDGSNGARFGESLGAGISRKKNRPPRRRRVAIMLAPVAACVMAVMVLLKPTASTEMTVPKKVTFGQEFLDEEAMGGGSNVDESISPALFATADERIIG